MPEEWSDDDCQATAVDDPHADYYEEPDDDEGD